MNDCEKEIEKLRFEISKKNKEIEELNRKLAECTGRVKELRDESKELRAEVTSLQVLKLDLKLRDFQMLEDENNRLKHRIEITKGLLDDARGRLDLLERVVEDFKAQGLVDRVVGKRPPSLIVYEERTKS